MGVCACVCVCVTEVRVNRVSECVCVCVCVYACVTSPYMNAVGVEMPHCLLTFYKPSIISTFVRRGRNSNTKRQRPRTYLCQTRFWTKMQQFNYRKLFRECARFPEILHNFSERQIPSVTFITPINTENRHFYFLVTLYRSQQVNVVRVRLRLISN